MTAALREVWSAAPPDDAWYNERRVRRALLVSLAVLLACNAVLSIFVKVTDFEWHLGVGEEFWTQRPYDPRFLPYLLPRIMLDGIYLPLGWELARAVAYLVALAFLAVSIATWQRLSNQADGPDRRQAGLGFASGALALLVLHPYLARDLNDCGPHVTTMMLAVLALAALMQGRTVVSGLLLATAAAWAVTPLLFLPFLLLKRQWRVSAAMAVGLIAWCLFPGFIIGWSTLIEYYFNWFNGLAKSFAADDLTALPYEPARHQSQALRMIFARYFTHFGPDHPIHLDNNLLSHPLFLQFLDLPMRTAKMAYGVLVLALGGFFAWRFRRPLRPASEIADQPWILPEWALVLLLMPLLAPTSWLHHYAVILPAALLVARDALSRGRSLPHWRKVAIGFIAVTLLLLQRDVVQKDLSIVVLSYKFDGISMILLAILTLTLPAMGMTSDLPGGATNGVDRKPASP